MQTGELSEAHIHNGTCLQFIEGKTLHQAFHSHLGVFAGFDDAHHFIDVVGSNNETLQNVLALLGFAEVETRAADDHIMAVFHEVTETFFEGEQLRAHLGWMRAGDGYERNAVDGKARFAGPSSYKVC